MPSVRIGKKAARDLVVIYMYGAEHFGQTQAGLFHTDLESCFRLLCENPRMGRERTAGEHLVRIFIHRYHVIVYQEARRGIDIVRVLGGRQNWLRIVEGD